MRARSAASLSIGVLAFALAHAAVAQLFTLEINTEITSMSASGTGAMPLGTDPAMPPANQGYLFVDSMVTATTSTNPAAKSEGTTSLSISLNPLDLTITVDTFSTFNFFLDLTFTDIDPVNDYATGLGSAFSLLADPTKPLIVTLTDSVTFDLADIPTAFPDNPGIVPSSNTVKHDLGVDVNNNSVGPDVLKYSAQNFAFGDDLSFSDDVFTSTTLDEIIDAILFGTGLPTLSAQISILSGSFVFTGTVDDPAADPPFQIAMIIGASSVPEPGTLLLLALGLAWLGAARGRRPARR